MLEQVLIWQEELCREVEKRVNGKLDALCMKIEDAREMGRVEKERDAWESKYKGFQAGFQVTKDEHRLYDQTYEAAER
jgi:hypothetical protein